jgi:predicted alpha-1,2-mannosidase
MPPTRPLLLAAALLAGGCAPEGSGRAELQPLHAAVDPFIGSGGRGWWAGNAFVGAGRPFGLVQVGPDTTTASGAFPFNHCSGYHAADDRLRAISHTHLHGTGIPDLGAIGFLPLAGPMAAERLAGERELLLDKDSERARPGYYAVELAEQGIRIELTAGRHSAHHRYRPLAPLAEGRLTLLVDVSHTLPMGRVRAGGIRVEARTGALDAWAHNENEFSRAFGGLPVYIHARFDPPPAACGTWRGDALDPQALEQEGADTGAWLEFAVAPERPLEVVVGVSFVDAAGARANLEASPAGAGFADSLAAAERAWRQALAPLAVAGGTPARRTVLATALYHSMLLPSSTTDADGRYRGLDGAVHRAEGFTYYSQFSLWDTYRSLHPLLCLLAPERQADMLRSLLAMAEHGGALPRWPLGHGYTNIMIGTPADVVLADSILKGIGGFDPQQALAAMRRTAEGPPAAGSGFKGREGIADYLELGYVAADRQIESVSRTQEFAIADFAIARLAAALGEDELAARYAGRARAYRHLFDAHSGFFRGRNADGSWVEPFDPGQTQFLDGDAYTEGNALQYLWLVPQDPGDLMRLLGGQAAMAERLAGFFEAAALELEEVYAGEHDDLWWMTRPPRHYWHGNEPDLHAAYLFLQAGRPDLCQRWLRWIADTLYHTGRDGLPGNDDAGTLSAWYVFSALGFYPLAGSDLYLLGAPLFERAELTLPGGVLRIEASDLSDANRYVQSVRLDGAELQRPWLRHADIAAGAELRFEMGPEPAGWGRLPPDSAIPTGLAELLAD